MVFYLKDGLGENVVDLKGERKTKEALILSDGIAASRLTQSNYVTKWSRIEYLIPIHM